MLKEKTKKEIRKLMDVKEALTSINTVMQFGEFCRLNLKDVLEDGDSPDRNLYATTKSHESSLESFFKEMSQGNAKTIQTYADRFVKSMQKAHRTVILRKARKAKKDGEQ